MYCFHEWGEGAPPATPLNVNIIKIKLQTITFDDRLHAVKAILIKRNNGRLRHQAERWYWMWIHWMAKYCQHNLMVHQKLSVRPEDSNFKIVCYSFLVWLWILSVPHLGDL